MRPALALIALMAAMPITALRAQEDALHSVERGISTGLDRFLEVYKVNGMFGVEDAVVDCYAAQKSSPTLEGLAACASMDKRAGDEDRAFSGRYGSQRVDFFKGKSPSKRLNAAVRSLKVDERQRKILIDAISKV